MTGAEGMLGSTMVPSLQKQGHKVIQTDVLPASSSVDYLDIRDQSQVKEAVKKHKPDAVFHLAAETDVDKCEQQQDHAYFTNTLGTENVARACKERKALMMYVSTAGVFYGDKAEPYTEIDEPNPKNVYGKTKLAGERFVQDYLDKYFIVRAGWMVGGFARDKKFVKKVLDQIFAGKSEIKAVYDKKGTPTFTADFSANILPLVETKQYGLYHMTNRGICSRYEVAQKIVYSLELEEKVRVIPVDSSAFPLPAPRADSEMMRNMRLDLLNINLMRPWEDALYEYIGQWKGMSEKRVL